MEKELLEMWEADLEFMEGSGGELTTTERHLKMAVDHALALEARLEGLGKKVKPKLSQHRKHVQRLRECQLSISLASVADRYEELIETSNQLIMIASRWQWMCDLLDMEEVPDFALSFPEVRKLDDIMRPWRDEAVLEAKERDGRS